MSQIYHLLTDRISKYQNVINDWFEQYKIEKTNFYNSIDIRHSGFKIAAIDSNCFPAGFNNLSLDSQKIASDEVGFFLQKHYPNIDKILIIAESHTRNIKYLENILILQKIINNSGRKAEISSLNTEIDNFLKINLGENDIIINQIIRQSDKIKIVNGFEPELIISNNDFTDGIFKILQNIEQDIIPNPAIGWFKRLKTNHFFYYNNLAKEFANLIDIDPWLILAEFEKCQELDFKSKIGFDDLVVKTEKLLNFLQEKHKEYNIKEDPYCFIKSDNGTYGMAVMNVKSADEVANLNKKGRNKMNMLKGNIQNNKVIIQEGITTIDKINNFNAEPMIYLINGQVVGNLFRYNQDRDNKSSLNNQFMAFTDLNNSFNMKLDIGGKIEDVIKIYEIIAKIAMLAVNLEIKNAGKDF